MASYQIVQQAPQPGFLQGLGQGIPQGANTFLQALLPAILKQQAATAEAEESKTQTNAYIEALREGGFEQSGATIGKEGGISRRFAKPKEAKPPTFLESSREAAKGDISFDALQELFPTKFDEITTMKDQLTPVEKAPGFTPGTGSPISHIKSFFSGEQAEINDQTQTVIDNIKNKADLDELRTNAKAYGEAGVDVKAILEHFGVN